MRPYLKFACVLAALAACGEGPLEPGEFTLTGRWEGRGFPYELALDLQQDGENNVSGDGEIRFLEQRLDIDTLDREPLRTDTTFDTVAVRQVPVEVSGDWDYPDFVLTLRAEDFADAQYDASYGRTSPDSITGRLQGSGFQNVSVPIVRQAAP